MHKSEKSITFAALIDKNIYIMKRISFTLLALCSLFSIASAQPIPEGLYYIRHPKNPNYVIDHGSEVYNGENIQLWEFNGSDAQKWKVTHDRGAIVIRSTRNNNYVIDHGGQIYNGENIQLWELNGTNAQRWYPEYINGYYMLHSAVDQHYNLDLNACGAYNGNNIHCWEDNHGDCQMWIFQAIDSGNGKQPSQQNGHEPKLHVTICPGCGGGGTIPWRNYITCKTCGGTGILSSYQ